MTIPARTAADPGLLIEPNLKLVLLDRVLGMSRAEKLDFAARCDLRGGVFAEVAASVRQIARVWHGDC